ncbi:MAG: PTS transporter subunit EIIB [Iodobacter sp.]|jgi:phosphotransferase system IIB component
MRDSFPFLLVAALGGWSNIRSLEVVALTRLRVELTDASRLDLERLEQAGVLAVMPLANHVCHLLIGPDAPRYLEILS